MNPSLKKLEIYRPPFKNCFERFEIPGTDILWVLFHDDYRNTKKD